MVVRWFDTADVTTFGASIVDEYCRLRSSTVVQTEKAKKKTQRFEKLVQKAAKYSREQGLNFYKKAKLINTIKIGLGEKDIPESEIDVFIKALLLSGLKRN